MKVIGILAPTATVLILRSVITDGCRMTLLDEERTVLAVRRIERLNIIIKT